MWTWATEDLPLLPIHQVVDCSMSAVEESPGCRCSVWRFSNTRGPSAPVGAAAKRCDGGTCSCQAVRRMRPPSCQGSFPCLGDGDWCAQFLCIPRSVQDKSGKEGAGRGGTRHLQEEPGMHKKRETIWVSTCLVQSVDISKNSSNVAGVGTSMSLATACRSTAYAHGWTSWSILHLALSEVWFPQLHSFKASLGLLASSVLTYLKYKANIK